MIRAVIHSQALRANLQRLREVAPGSRIMAVVKANAYGHGLVPVALALADADAFAVARIEEAVALRAAGVRRPVVLLEGVFTADQLEEAARLELDLVVHQPEQLQLLAQLRSTHRFVVWLKIDTGMNRLGFRVEQFAAALQQLQGLSERVREIRVLTHLARADEPADPMNSLQVKRFSALVQGLGLPLSIANSAALLANPQAHADWVRPGLALYGVSPLPGRTAEQLGLVPAMTLETRVISLRQVPVGETVGYGATWRATRDSQVAIIAAGYGDGLPLGLPLGTRLWVGAQALPLVGRVSMDMLAVDVTDSQQPVSVGTPVQLWGPQLPVEQMAASAGTLPYELLCGISQRVPLILG
jgi:alanine racemase